MCATPQTKAAGPGSVGPVGAQLYGASLSYPSRAARAMLGHKGIEYDWVKLQPGLHPFQLRLAGFRGGTIPALKLDGRRVMGSRPIARFIDELEAEPPLFPADPSLRRAVEEAEEWGDTVLQPIPRRLLRWAFRHDREARVALARVFGTSRPELAARFMGPMAAFIARREDARSTARVRADWAALPGHLDHVEQLISDGVIGQPEPNAADFQIGATLRAMLEFDDYEPLLSGRPLEDLARRLMRKYPFRIPPLIHLVR